MGNPVQLGALSLSPPKPYAPPRVKQDKAAWLVGGKGFFDDKDKLWQPGQALYFEGEPSLELMPLNKLAYDKQQELLDRLDAFEMAACKKKGVTFVKKDRKEWNEGEVDDGLPQPESVMGVRKEGHNEAIR